MLPLCRLHELHTNFRNVTFIQIPSNKQLTTYHTHLDNPQQTIVNADLYEIIYPKSHPLYEPNTVTTLRVDSETKEAKLNRFTTSHYETFRTKGAVNYFFQNNYLHNKNKPVLHSEKIPSILTNKTKKWVYYGTLHHPTLPASTEKEKIFNIPPSATKLSLKTPTTKIVLSPETKTYSFVDNYLTQNPTALSNHPEDFFNPTKPLTERINSGVKITLHHKNLPLFEYLFTQATTSPENTLQLEKEDLTKILTPTNIETLYKYGKEIFPEQETENIPAEILIKIIYTWITEQVIQHPDFKQTKTFTINQLSSINPIHFLINQTYVNSLTLFDKE